MKAKSPIATVAPESDAGLTIHNRLQPGHHYQAAMDEVFRVALRGLTGPWDVSVHPAGRAWFRIDVVAPDGASWSTSVPVDEGPSPEDLEDTVRAACVRHCRLRPANGTRRAGKPPQGPSGNRDGGPKAGLQGERAEGAPSSVAQKGPPK